MTTKQLREQARKVLKTLGYTNRQVSLKVECTGLNDSVRARVKSEDVDVQLLKTELKKLSYVDRCEASGEILSGGNTYVSVEGVNGFTI